MFTRLIAILFCAAFGFVIIGLAVTISSAAYEGITQTPLEDGTTLEQCIDENKTKLKEFYGPTFEGVDVKKVVREDVKELNKVGKQKVKEVKQTAEKIIDELDTLRKEMEQEN